jgi:hypothetical protein
MSILDGIRAWRERRRERARADAERIAQARGHLTAETNAEGREAAEHPPKPGELGRWER